MKQASQKICPQTRQWCRRTKKENGRVQEVHSLHSLSAHKCALEPWEAMLTVLALPVEDSSGRKSEREAKIAEPRKTIGHLVRRPEGKPP